MNIAGHTKKLRGALAVLGDLPGRISGRLKTKIAGFDQTIAGFRQRRWS